MIGNFSPTERLLASQEGVYSVKFAINSISTLLHHNIECEYVEISFHGSVNLDSRLFSVCH
jgi:hypothetical protein